MAVTASDLAETISLLRDKRPEVIHYSTDNLVSIASFTSEHSFWFNPSRSSYAQAYWTSDMTIFG